MTTCAWDGKTLAADSRCSIGSLPATTTKAYRLKDGRLYCGAGDAAHMQAVLHWLNADADKPTVKDFCAMIINLDGSIERLEDTLVLFPINCPFHAIGSGRDFAISAMSMGKTAKEGVELAAQWDLWTGGPIIELQLEWRRID